MTKKISLFVVLFLVLVAAVVFAQKYKVDIKALKDGTYMGKYEFTHAGMKDSVEAKVMVMGGKLKNIELTKPGPMPVAKKAPEAFKMMIAKNDIEADAKTMATLKAVVYNALTSKMMDDKMMDDKKK